MPLKADWKTAKTKWEKTCLPKLEAPVLAQMKKAGWDKSDFGKKLDAFDTAKTLPDKRSAWAVPPALTFGIDTPQRKLLSATPLVWRSENKVKGSVAWSVFPWVSYRDTAQRNRVLFPLYWQFDDLTTRSTTAHSEP